MNTALATDSRRIVAALTGRRVQQAQPIDAGVMTWKCHVVTHDGSEFVVRFYPPGRAHVLHYEPDVIQRCHAHGMRCPELVGDARQGPPAAWPYIVYRHIQGVPASQVWPGWTGHQRAGLAQHIVSQVQSMATLSTTGCGELLDAHRGQHAHWRDFVADCFDAGLHAARQHPVLSDAALNDAQWVRARLQDIPLDDSHGLLWADVSLDNVIVTADGALAGLIDFEGTLSGDALLNLGYAFARSPGGDAGSLASDDVHAHLHASWGIRDTVSNLRIRLYAMLRVMRLLRYSATQTMPAGTPRSPVERHFPGFQRAATELRDLLI